MESLDVKPVDEFSTGRILTLKTIIIGNLLTFVPLVLMFAGIGLVAAGAYFAFPNKAAAGGNVAAGQALEGLVLGGLGIVVGGLVAAFSAFWGLRNPTKLGNWYLHRLAHHEIKFRVERLVDPDDPEALFVEIVPRQNWGRMMLETATDVGFLLIDQRRREVLFEGDRERIRIPADAIVRCAVESTVVGEQTLAATTYFLTVIRAGARDQAGLREFPFAYRGDFGTLGAATRERRAAILRDRVQALLPDVRTPLAGKETVDPFPVPAAIVSLGAAMPSQTGTETSLARAGFAGADRTAADPFRAALPSDTKSANTPQLPHDPDWQREFFDDPAVAGSAFATKATPAPSDFDDDAAGVLAEIDRLQRQKANWWATLLVLLVSAVLFFLIGKAAWSWKVAALLIPILLFHELGHYVAMLVFGYRNVRMFFIPLFGAAVIGRNYNVAAWKKAVVSLMGPLPGIALGLALGIVAMVAKQRLLLEAATLMIFLNGFNLLPFLPLDGGWNLHALFFSRHSVLDAGFRLLAAVALVLGSILMRSFWLIYLGVAMLLALPMEYRRSQIVARLRREGFAAQSFDSQTIPESMARRIIHELRTSFPKRMSDKTTARLTLQTFEALNARPPGWFATFFLSGLHFAAFVVALVSSVVFFAGMQARAMQLQAARAPRGAGRVADIPENDFACGTVQTWRGTQASDRVEGHETLFGTFPSVRHAESAFRRLTPGLPARASATLFGQSVLVTLPSDPVIHARWLATLKARWPNVDVSGPKSLAFVTLVCTAPNEVDAEQLARATRSYIMLARMGNLIPPWSPTDHLTPAQQKARITYTNIQEALTQLMTQRRFTNHNTIDLATKGKDQIEAMAEAFDRIHRESVTAAVAKVRKEGEAAVDLKLLDLYAAGALAKGSRRQKADERRKSELLMGQRMGQLPLENGKPKPDVERFSTAMGSVTRTGTELRFGLSFEQIEDGLPAMANWLCGSHCAEFKYQIVESGADDGAED